MNESTTFLLVRHTAHALDHDTIAGRMPGVHLREEGRTQAIQLADRLAQLPIRAIYCSPLERSRETAQPLAERLELHVQICNAFNEIDFGEWTGRRLDELRQQPRWRDWNEFRSGTRIPGGETMTQVLTRVMDALETLRLKHHGQCVAIFSHGDVIKSAVGFCLGVPLDLCKRIEISLASVSAIALDDCGPSVLCVNHTAPLLPGT